jgi:hypothetical protein
MCILTTIWWIEKIKVFNLISLLSGNLFFQATSVGRIIFNVKYTLVCSQTTRLTTSDPDVFFTLTFKESPTLRRSIKKLVETHIAPLHGNL